MSAAEQRKLLEALMGKEALYGGSLPMSHFTDDNVCRDFLCGLCPNDLFTNTKMDMGPCQRVHSEALREEYLNAKSKGQHPGFDREHALSLGTFVAECDRKSQQAFRKIDSRPEDNRAMVLMGELSDLDFEVFVLLEQLQTAGEEGRMEAAIELLHTVQFLHDRRDFVERELKLFEVGSGATQTQKLRICYRCSASLSIFDSDRRLADHFAGKMHLGFVKIRETLEELKAAGFGQGRDVGVSDGRDFNPVNGARPRDSRSFDKERRGTDNYRRRSRSPVSRRGDRRF